MSSRKIREGARVEGEIHKLLTDRSIGAPVDLVTQFERLRARVRREKRYGRPFRHGWERPFRGDHELKDEVEVQFVSGMDVQGGQASQAGLKCWALDWELIERRSRES